MLDLDVVVDLVSPVPLAVAWRQFDLLRGRRPNLLKRDQYGWTGMDLPASRQEDRMLALNVR